MTEAADLKFMKVAMALSKKGMGFTEPNPMVGAVVVKEGRIVSTGYHMQCGKPHAEAIALDGIDAQNSTLYVSLEPCAHYGKTPPCVDLVVENKVKRVVIAMQDPNPKVNGKSIRKLKDAGIRVDVGVLEKDALTLNRHYLTYITSNRPYVTLNAGVSIDGKLTDKYRKSQWITDEDLRLYSHSMRGEFSAILAGVKTVLDDNPQLTVREDAWTGKTLHRVILDTNNVLDTGFRIFEEQENFPLILFSSREAPNTTPKAKRHFFVEPDRKHGGLDLTEILARLHRLGIASVLVEGGGAVINSFLANGFFDEAVFFIADKLLGGNTNESVQLFAHGATVADPLTLKNRQIVQLDSGFIIRGFNPKSQPQNLKQKE